MFRPVSTLNIPEYKIKELHNKGYIFCEDVNIATLKSEVGISSEEWEKLTSNSQVKTALDLCHEETVSGHIVTFSSAIDNILGGGIPLKLITEFCGLPGSGKTQICLQLCVSVQMPDCFGGLEGQAVYIDTGRGFTPHRLTEMAKGCLSHCHLVANTLNSFDMMESLKSFTEVGILNGVYYLETTKFTELLASLNLLKTLLGQNSKIKLIVIDNITDPVKNSTLDYFERIQILYSFLSELQDLAIRYEFAIVITNDMTNKVDNQQCFYLTPSLGDSFAHRVNTRVLLKRKSNEFAAKFLKNVLNPETDVPFQVTSAGIRDVEAE